MRQDTQEIRVIIVRQFPLDELNWSNASYVDRVGLLCNDTLDPCGLRIEVPHLRARNVAHKWPAVNLVAKRQFDRRSHPGIIIGQDSKNANQDRGRHLP